MSRAYGSSGRRPEEAATESQLAAELAHTIDPPLVDALLRAYRSLTENYHLGRWRPGELEAGDFSEVCYRILQWLTSSPAGYDPLGAHVPNLPAKLRNLENLPSTHHVSLRLHIPRALLLLTDIRNQRGVAHTAGEVSPNVADASLLLVGSGWVLAELLRLSFSCAPEEAQRLVDSLAVRRTPLLQEFEGFLKILNPGLPLATKLMALLYQRGAEGATNGQLSQWLQVAASQQPTVRATLSRLDRNRGWVHRAHGRNLITLAGIAWVEEQPDLSPLLR